jgi:hypothetical protein
MATAEVAAATHVPATTVTAAAAAVTATAAAVTATAAMSARHGGQQNRGQQCRSDAA